MLNDQNNNGRVTLARLEEKIDAMREDVRDLCHKLADHEMRIRANRERLIEHDQKLGTFQAAQALLTLVASSIAAWLGMRT